MKKKLSKAILLVVLVGACMVVDATGVEKVYADSSNIKSEENIKEKASRVVLPNILTNEIRVSHGISVTEAFLASKVVFTVDGLHGNGKYIEVDTNDYNKINFNKAGIYPVEFLAHCGKGDCMTSKVINVIVEENNKPVINTFTGTKLISIKQGTPFNPYNYIKDVKDKEDDLKNIDLKNHVIVSQNNVDVNTYGTYKVVYKVLDSGGSVGELELSVRVMRDSNAEPNYKIKPAIVTNNNIVRAGSQFNPLDNVKAVDMNGKDLTPYILVTGNNVDANTQGEYTVSYAILDSYGNRTDKTTTVKVVPKNNPLISVWEREISLNSTFRPLDGVSSRDIYGTDLTQHVIVTKNNVDTSKAGVYDVSYAVLDSKGNRTDLTVKITVR